jgi:hypothetical protein
MSQKRKKEQKIKTSREINANNGENYAISPERLNITYQAKVKMIGSFKVQTTDYPWCCLGDFLLDSTGIKSQERWF